MISPACTILSSLFTYYYQQNPVDVIGVPVIDSMFTAFKFAEMMVDLV